MKYKYLTSIAIICITIFISLISVISRDREISDLEGRTLQQLPTPGNIIDESFNSNAYLYELLTGTMFSKWDSYFSDHIYERDTIVNAFTDIQDKLNKKYINGAFIGEDNYIFSPSGVMGLNNSQLKENANHFNKIANKFSSSKSYIVNLPNKSMVYEEKLPISDYNNPDNKYIDEMIRYINCDEISVLDFRSIIDSNEDLYYKTDHHWNMNGAYKAYEYIINNLNKDFDNIGRPNSKDDFDIDKYENYFVGTDGRKVGQLVNKAEDVEIYKGKYFDNYKVYNQDGKFKLIHEEVLDSGRFNNDYMVYLGGDNAEIKIENSKASNDLNVVMIGDSMDNALIPLMADHFKKLYSYDFRHYSGNIVETIENINPDIIIYIGLSQNFINGPQSGVFKWDI